MNLNDIARSLPRTAIKRERERERDTDAEGEGESCGALCTGWGSLKCARSLIYELVRVSSDCAKQQNQSSVKRANNNSNKQQQKQQSSGKLVQAYELNGQTVSKSTDGQDKQSRRLCPCSCCYSSFAYCSCLRDGCPDCPGCISCFSCIQQLPLGLAEAVDAATAD